MNFKFCLFFLFLLVGNDFLFSQQTSHAVQDNSDLNHSQKLDSELFYKDTWTSPFILDEMTIDPIQNQDYRINGYTYPSKPKNSFEFGIGFGRFILDDDIIHGFKKGYGLSLHLRKSINYSFSVRGELFYGNSHVIEPFPRKHKNNLDANNIGGGLIESTFDMYNPMTGGPGEWFPAYKITYTMGTISLIINFGNLIFHRPRNKVNLYMGLGIGAYFYDTRLDLFDSNGLPYDGVSTKISWTLSEFNTSAGRKRYKQELLDLYDGEYETKAFKSSGIGTLGDQNQFYLSVVPTIGLSRKLNKRFNISLEHSIFFTNNDYLDGLKFRTNFDQTNSSDVGHYSNIRIGINIGNFQKVTEPLYWLNPIDQAYNEVSSLRKNQINFSEDSDGDGVIDLIDKEMDTRENCPVDTKGIILDSDGDGIVDCDDIEPYSIPGCPVNEFGKAICKTETVMDSLFQDALDSMSNEFERLIIENNLIKENQEGISHVRNNATTDISSGKTISHSKCGDWFLPMIHFDINSYTIKPQYYSHLYSVAEVMQKCPDICIAVIGHTDTRHNNNFNTLLSYKRAHAVVEHLHTKFSIARNRIILMYNGETLPLIGLAKNEASHMMNRRVEIRTCQSTDLEMDKPTEIEQSLQKHTERKMRKSVY